MESVAFAVAVVATAMKVADAAYDAAFLLAECEWEATIGCLCWSRLVGWSKFNEFVSVAMTTTQIF